MYNFIHDLWYYFPRRLPLLLVLSALTSFSEGIVLLLIYPFLSILTNGAMGGGRILEWTNEAFQWIGAAPSALAMVILIVLVSCIQYGTRIGQAWLSADMQALYISLIRRGLFDAILKARWSFFIDSRDGELTNTLSMETILGLNVIQHFTTAFSSTVNALSLIIVSCFLSLPGTLVLLGLIAFAGVASYPFFRRGFSVGRVLSDLNESLAGWTSDVLVNAKFFKATGSEHLAQKRYNQIMGNMEPALRKSIFSPQLLRCIVEFAAIALLVGFLIVGTIILKMDLLRMMVILAIFIRLLPKLTSIFESFHSFASYLPSIAQVRDLRHKAEAAVEPLILAPPSTPDGAFSVSIRDLFATYGDRIALDGVTLDIPAGKLTAIVGASGAGKTTLVDCLLGLTEYHSGEILVDGEKLTWGKMADWRRTIGYQSQDPIMLNSTIRENITWGRFGYADEDLLEAADKAGIAGFIDGLADGFDSQVGERGNRLSGGQRQRIGLARALLSQKRVLILDEATSALDAATEQGIINNIRLLAGEVTVVMITHRLATTQYADRIYVLDAGKVVESGTWSQLITGQGVFSDLWKHQSE